MFLETIEGKWKSISVLARCDECGTDYKAKISTALKQEQLVGHHQCRRCSSRRAGLKTGAKMREAYSMLYSGEGNPAKKPGVGDKISKSKKGKDLSDDHKKALRKPKTVTSKFLNAMSNPQLRKQRSDRMTQNNPAKRPEVREKISNTVSEKYANGEYNFPKYKTGWFSHQKCKESIWYRSELERDFLEQAVSWNEIVAIESAEKLRIEYEYAGATHRYLPDFKLYFDNGLFIIVEMKSSYFATVPKWSEKLEALEKFSEKLGIRYIVLSEKEEKEWRERLSELKRDQARRLGILSV
jgi:Holliday junction resolvase/DNA-directed RNA polymerase subunit RPC12/RpoP